MSDSKPLQNETVIFTGTPKSLEIFDHVREYGGEPISLPLIRISEVVEVTDELRIKACPTYDWLIFTSQSAVSSFGKKLKRHAIAPETIPSKIAAVGTRTAEALEKLGFQVDFIPTVYSADTFVKEFKPMENDIRRLLFLRGSIAGGTIKEELPFDVDEWTIYATEQAGESIGSLIDLLNKVKQITVLFASPSAVAVFAKEVAPVCGWNGFTIGAIGHVTEQALLEEGAHADVIPDTYTLKDLVDAVARRKEGL